MGEKLKAVILNKQPVTSAGEGEICHLSFHTHTGLSLLRSCL